MNNLSSQNLLEIVRNNYEEIASDFNETRKKALWPELFNLTKDVKDGVKILDAGCGNGRLLEALAGKKINYFGVDNSRGLIALAQKNYPQSNFQVLDILNLNELKENNFDYIFSIAVIHHLPGSELQIKALKLMAEKLKSDGQLILSVQNFWHKKKYLKLILQFSILKLFGFNRVGWGDLVFPGFKNESLRYYHVFMKCGLKKICRQAGFKIKKIYSDKFNYYLILEIV
jgi:2-polyprenyl-3-methyl-5-hydroxy-6-metoxy-1,4-benzoquinol methylase